MRKKPKILVVGSFVMDLIASAEQAPRSGETVIGTAFHTAPGGKGANQAVQCARLGAQVTMMGCVGGDSFADGLLEAVHRSGVDVSHVRRDSAVSSGIGHILLEVTEHGTQNRITVIPGANRSLRAEDAAWIRAEIGSFDCVLLQMEIPAEVNLAVAGWAEAAGVPVMFNPAPAGPLPDELLRCVTYLTPNEQEAAVESGLPLRMDGDAPVPEDMAAVAAALRSKGAAHVVITLGRRGSAVVEPGGVRYVPAVRMPRVLDPTGAGDSFVAALSTGLCAGLDQTQALTFASYTAAITVSGMGAMPSLPTLAQVRALLAERNEQGVDLQILDRLA